MDSISDTQIIFVVNKILYVHGRCTFARCRRHVINSTVFILLDKAHKNYVINTWCESSFQLFISNASDKLKKN